MKPMIFKFMTWIFCAALLGGAGLVAMGQASGNNPVNQGNQPDKKEKIEAMKVAYITQKIALTTVEAEKFWPIYNEFNTQRDELARTKKQLEKVARETGFDQLTDQQAEELLNSELNFEQQVLDLKKEYIAKYKAVIGIKKTAMFFKAEKEFNNFLLKQLKEADRSPKKP